MSTVDRHDLPHGNIMIVEDTISDLKFLSEILTNQGYEVRAASDGELALRSIRAKLPDLILLDINLPDINGVEVCRQLKADPLTKNVPVIFTSAEREADMKVKTFETGAIDYVTKPYESSELIARIGTHLKMSRLQQKLEIQTQNLTAEIEARSRAEKALQKAHDELDMKVVERTKELMRANKELSQYAHVVSRDLKTPLKAIKKHSNFLNDELKETLDSNLKKCLENLMQAVNEADEDAAELTRVVAERDRHLNLAQDLICIAGMDGYFRYVSPSWEKILGYTTQELMSRPFLDFIHPDDHVKNNDEVENLESGNNTLDFENRYIHKDGSIIIISWLATPVVSENVMYCTGRDITDRKKQEEEKRILERQVQHAQKLESLGVLAGGIAHDFNNILMGVLGNAELCLHELPPENPVRDNIRDIVNAAMRAAELAKQMLAYSGKGKFVIEAINVNRMIEEMIYLLNTTISKTAVLKFNLSKNIFATEVDVTQVRQVFMNLVTNASEAIGEKSGVVTISTGVMEVTKEYLKGVFVNKDVKIGFYTFIEVSDTGCGMDKETQQKMFDPFFTTKFSGRGLGMAATLGIIRGHNGAIKVYSELGRGTTMKVLFPCSDETIEDIQTKSGNSLLLDQWQGEGVILVVDDEESVRAVVKKTLTKKGFKVLTAQDGREGVKIFNEESHKISLVILDITMPHMGGQETYSEIRKIQDDTRVLLSSGYNEEEATNSFAGKGLAGFLQKPYKPSELVKKVYDLLENK